MSTDALARAEARIDASTGEFVPISWTELASIIASDELHLLTRNPTQLAEYNEWKSSTLPKYGSIESFILTERLHWKTPIVRSHEALFGPGDYEILWNDFPYAFAPGIQHLVVWMKAALPTTPTGTLTPLAEKAVADFVRTTFGTSHVQYFMNPASLKSIGSLEHFHVLLKDVDGRQFLTSKA